MAKLIVSIDGVVIREIELTKERTSIGRRPYNDVVIDNLAVSGEHAALQISGADYFVEDLNSTNGSYLNGKALKRERLNSGDIVEIGKYKIKFVGDDPQAQKHEATMIMRPGAMPVAAAAAAPVASASIRVISGAAAGREVVLTKVVTTIGKPGLAVAAITKRMSGYVVAHVDGEGKTLLNGNAIGADPVHLKSGDKLELAGTEMQFVAE